MPTRRKYSAVISRTALTARRKAETRREIAETALALFARHGYDNVTAEVIADEADVSLRTFYRYFSAKDEVLSPIITDGSQEFIERIAVRPALEDLATAVHRAFEQVSPPRGVPALIRVLTDVPALRARWLNGLRTIEDALVPIVHQRATRPLTDEQAHLTAAAVVTSIRVALELSARSGASDPLADTLDRALRYLRDGANL